MEVGEGVGKRGNEEGVCCTSLGSVSEFGFGVSYVLCFVFVEGDILSELEMA